MQGKSKESIRGQWSDHMKRDPVSGPIVDPYKMSSKLRTPRNKPGARLCTQRLESTMNLLIIPTLLARSIGGGLSPLLLSGQDTKVTRDFLSSAAGRLPDLHTLYLIY